MIDGDDITVLVHRGLDRALVKHGIDLDASYHAETDDREIVDGVKMWAISFYAKSTEDRHVYGFNVAVRPEMPIGAVKMEIDTGVDHLARVIEDDE